MSSISILTQSSGNLLDHQIRCSVRRPHPSGATSRTMFVLATSFSMGVSAPWLYKRFMVKGLWGGSGEKEVYSRSGLTCFIHHLIDGNMSRIKVKRLEKVITSPSPPRPGTGRIGQQRSPRDTRRNSWTRPRLSCPWPDIPRPRRLGGRVSRV